MADLAKLATAGKTRQTKRRTEHAEDATVAFEGLIDEYLTGKVSDDELGRVVSVLHNPSSAHAGQQSGPRALGGGSGQPASPGGGQQYGSGPEEDARQAFAVLYNSPVLSEGQRNLLSRVFAQPGSPTHMKVEQDGTPEEVTRLRQEVQTKNLELQQERDEHNPSSLAGKLKAEKAKPAGAGGPVPKAKIDEAKAKIDEVVGTVNSAGHMGKRRILSGDQSDKVLTALDEAKTALS